MTEEKKGDLHLSLGEELLAEAAAALFEDVESIALEISPEEAAEFEALRARAVSLKNKDYALYDQDDALPIAAENDCDD